MKPGSLRLCKRIYTGDLPSPLQTVTPEAIHQGTKNKSLGPRGVVSIHAASLAIKSLGRETLPAGPASAGRPWRLDQQPPRNGKNRHRSSHCSNWCRYNRYDRRREQLKITSPQPIGNTCWVGLLLPGAIGYSLTPGSPHLELLNATRTWPGSSVGRATD